ncbi:MAG TPA: inositol monophosphatase family protein, partial [Gemmatimonadales bacterium]|nr:inositol monophosphatase family protein [Gemmatimonadales bacterium]
MARAESLLQPLLALHERVRDAVVDACTRRSTEHLATVAVDGAQDGDTIYAVDRVAEETLAQGLADLARDEPLCVVGEGLGDTLGDDGRWRLLVDPIDGTRGLMYQKRSAWILTGVAPNRGSDTRLRDIVLAVQTEIPLVKQHLADQLWTFRGQEMQARRYNRVTGSYEHLTLHPSRADTIAHGFATVVRFFPGAREVLAAIDDEV